VFFVNLQALRKQIHSSGVIVVVGDLCALPHLGDHEECVALRLWRC
jgi:hypothetical protein